EITKFKAENQGRLPEQFQSNVQFLNSLQTQLSNVNEALNRNQQEKIMLQTQHQNQQTQLNYYTNNLEDVIPDADGAIKNERLITLNKLISDLNGQLAAMLESYREDHPDIKALRARLRAYEAERKDLDRQEALAQTAAVTATQPRKVINPQIAKSIEDTKA